VRAKVRRCGVAVLGLLGLLLAVFAYMVSVSMGPVSPTVSGSGRYVGRSPDRCPYVSAKQVAEIVGQNVTRVSATHDWYTEGGSGCFYDLAASADVYSQHGVIVEYFPGMGRAGFWNRADVVDGVSVSGLGIEAVWSRVALTVLIRGSDVAVVSLDGSLAQATKIYRLAAPHLLPAVAANWTGGPALGSDARICRIYNANRNPLNPEVIMAALRKAGRSITPALARDMVNALTARNDAAFWLADHRVAIGCDDEVAQGTVPDQ
jgi:hypothetical protein